MLDPIQKTTMLEEVANGDAARAVQFLNDNHPADSAELLEALDVDASLSLLQKIDAQGRADIFCELPRAYQVDIAALLEPRAIANLVARLDPDDRVDLLKSVPSEQKEEVLAVLARADREDVERLASYEEGTAGAIMTSEFMTLPASLTAAQAMERIRLAAPNKESIYSSYIVDRAKHLLGRVTLRDLILAEPNEHLVDIMDLQVASVGAAEDQEAAIYKLSHYDLLDIPVIDEAGSIVGIITHDDAMSAMEEEHTEDMERFMAISGDHTQGYLQTGVWSHFLHRVPWLAALAAFGLVSGSILQSFESLLTNLMILAFYMPMLADTGGNTGSQSATVVIRAIALKEIVCKDALRVVWKEFRIAMLLSMVLGVLAYLRVIFFTNAGQIPAGLDAIHIAFAVSLALGIQVMSATVVGAALPLLAKKFGADPALVASPLLTTVVDITGLFIYFNTAKLVLGL